MSAVAPRLTGMTTVGITLQVAGFALTVIGTLITGGALMGERRHGHEVRVYDLPRLPGRKANPWVQPLKLPRLRHRSQANRDRQQWAQGQGGLFGRPDPGTQFRGSDPDVLELTEYLTAWLKERERLAAAEWDRQTRLDREVLEAIKLSFTEQSAALVAQQNATRARVQVEMTGLSIALVGTVLAAFGGLLTA